MSECTDTHSLQTHNAPTPCRVNSLKHGVGA